MQKNNPYLVVNLSASFSPDHMLGKNSADRGQALKMLKDLTDAFERYVDDASKKSMSDSDKDLTDALRSCQIFINRLVEDFDYYWYKKWDYVLEAVYKIFLWWKDHRPQEVPFNEDIRDKAQKFYDFAVSIHRTHATARLPRRHAARFLVSKCPLPNTASSNAPAAMHPNTSA